LPVSKPLGAGCSHQAPCLRFRKDASSHGFRGEQYSHAIAPQTGGSAAQAGTQAGRAAVQDGAADSEPIPVLPMTPHGGARRARNRALMMVMERSRGGGLH